jgi:hypothetical protein
VKIDESGLLRWERDGDLVDTTSGRWMDSGDGSGIVSYDINKKISNMVNRRRTSFEEDGPSRPVSNRSAISQGSEDSQNATHYVDTLMESNPLKRWYRRHFTATGLTDKLLRKTVKRNTWIYVAVWMVVYLHPSNFLLTLSSRINTVRGSHSKVALHSRSYLYEDNIYIGIKGSTHIESECRSEY